jgi:hypothetical protein
MKRSQFRVLPWSSQVGCSERGPARTIVRSFVNGGEVVLQTGAVVGGAIAFSGAGTLEIFGSAMPSVTFSTLPEVTKAVPPPLKTAAIP